MFPSFEIFGRTIGMYSLTTIVGIICAGFLVYFLARKKGIIFDHIVLAGLSALAGMFTGGHLLYGITRLPDFFMLLDKHPELLDSSKTLFSLLGETFGGMVFFGGVFGGILGVYFFAKFTKKSTRLYLNAFAPAFALIHAFGRIGCFLGGCCYGIHYEGPLHVHFPEIAVIGYANADIADFPRFPVQLLESLAEFLICLMLVLLFKKYGEKISLIKVYLFSYSIVRFLDEFLRGDFIRGFWGPFSTSQWVSIGIILVITFLFVWEKIKKKRQN